MILKSRYCLILAYLFLILSVSPALTAEKSPTIISIYELHNMVEDGTDFVLIDARTEDLFKTGHIPGAISLPADKVNSESLAEHADDMNKKLVFYCADTSCPASRISAAKAIGAGYKYVYELPGGFAEWKNESYSVTKAQLKSI